MSRQAASVGVVLLAGFMAGGCSHEPGPASPDAASGAARMTAADAAAESDAVVDPIDATGVDPIDARIERLFADDPEFGTVDRAQIRRMLELPPEQDGPFFMLNFVLHRERAQYPDGRHSDLSGAAADSLYGEAVLPILGDIGAEPVFVAAVEMTLMSDDDTRWDQIAIVRYPSRAAFFDMLERDDFREASLHKRAGVARSLVVVAHPPASTHPDGFRSVDLAAVPYPAAAGEPPLVIAHLYAYRERAVYPDGRETDLSGREAVNLYTEGRGEQGVAELGVRPGLWLEVEGALLTDDRQWNEFRLNLFPSHQTFWAVAATGQEAGIEHRSAGLAHHYTLMTNPVLNAYGYE